MIVAEPESPTVAVSGAALTKEEARVTVSQVPDVPGTSWEIFSRIAERNVTVDMIVQNVGAQGKANMSFTVPKDELATTLEAVQEAADVLGAFDVSSDDHVSKVSVVGLGMAEQSGVADRMFRALADGGINIEMVTTSEIKISTLINRDNALSALRIVHQAFNLHEAPADARQPTLESNHPIVDAADVVERLQGVDMEELTIDAIDMDDTQARVTIHGIPDTPGIAARVFEEVAAASIFVDMIVQSFGHEGLANMSFTVPREKLRESLTVAKRLGQDLACGRVTSSPGIAKLFGFWYWPP